MVFLLFVLMVVSLMFVVMSVMIVLFCFVIMSFVAVSGLLLQEPKRNNPKTPMKITFS